MAIMVTPKLANLPDVTTTTPSDGQVLTYDTASGKWINEDAASGGVTDHGALTGLGDDDHTQYLLADGSRAVSDDLTLAGNVTTGQEVGALLWKNNGTTVGKIATLDAGGGQNDGDLVIYSALNGTLSEKVRFPALGAMQANEISSSASTMRLSPSLAVEMYTASSAHGNYAYFSRAGGSYLRALDSTTSTVINALILDMETTNTPAAGFGVGLLFRLESSTTAAQSAAQISAVWSTATHATRTGDLVFSTVSGGAALSEKLRLTGAGILKFSGTMGNSTKVPGTDAPADWVQIDIGGTTLFIPCYSA